MNPARRSSWNKPSPTACSPPLSERPRSWASCWMSAPNSRPGGRSWSAYSRGWAWSASTAGAQSGTGGQERGVKLIVQVVLHADTPTCCAGLAAVLAWTGRAHSGNSGFPFTIADVGPEQPHQWLPRNPRASQRSSRASSSAVHAPGE